MSSFLQPMFGSPICFHSSSCLSPTTTLRHLIPPKAISFLIHLESFRIPLCHLLLALLSPIFPQHQLRSHSQRTVLIQRFLNTSLLHSKCPSRTTDRVSNSKHPGRRALPSEGASKAEEPLEIPRPQTTLMSVFLLSIVSPDYLQHTIPNCSLTI